MGLENIFVHLLSWNGYQHFVLFFTFKEGSQVCHVVSVNFMHLVIQSAKLNNLLTKKINVDRLISSERVWLSNKTWGGSLDNCSPS